MNLPQRVLKQRPVNQTNERQADSGLLDRIRGHARGKKRKSDKELRIQVRWIHYDQKSEVFVPVRQKKAGGNRFVAYTASEPLTVEELKQKATTLFFPNGKSAFAAAGTKRRSQVTDHRSHVTGHRSQVAGHRKCNKKGRHCWVFCVYLCFISGYVTVRHMFGIDHASCCSKSKRTKWRKLHIVLELGELLLSFGCLGRVV